MGNNWTQNQENAINTRGRSLLVSAGAGAGKTAVLVERIISIITDKNDPVDVDQLLVVTFTRAAAAEMRERVRRRLSDMLRAYPKDANLKRQLSLIHNANICTIDSFCARVVRENFEKVDIDPDFRIADQTEVDLLESDVLDELLEEKYEEGDEDFYKLVDRYSGDKLTDELKDIILKLYRYSQKAVDPKEWLKGCIRFYDFDTYEEFRSMNWVEDVFESYKKDMLGLIENMNMAGGISRYLLCEEGEELSADKTSGDMYQNYKNELRDYVDEGDFEKKIPSFGAKRSLKGLDVELARLSNLAFKTIRLDNVTKKLESLVDNYKFYDNEQACRDIIMCRSSVNSIIELTLEFMDSLAQEKNSRRIMDFNDEAHYALRILVNRNEKGEYRPSEYALELKKQYREIMIDEYQDSNFLQETILNSIAGGPGYNNVFQVGDVKQSIYRFRQADPKLFQSKFDSYSPDLSKDECLITLAENFRSRCEVVDGVNYIFDYIMSRDLGGIDYRNTGNRLVAAAKFPDLPKGQDNRTEFVCISSGDESKKIRAKEGRQYEALYIARRIKEIVDPIKGMKVRGSDGNLRNARYSDIVILLRVERQVGLTFYESLEDAGIPAYLEQKTGFYDTYEIGIMMDLLSVIDNPRQDIPLASVLHSPLYRISAENLADIKLIKKDGDFYEKVSAYIEEGKNEVLKLKLSAFFEDLKDYRFAVNYMNVSELVEYILDKTDFDRYVRAMPNGERRFLNLSLLREIAAKYETTSMTGLFNFLRYTEKVQVNEEKTGEASENSGAGDVVRIMTIHKSKGLQFPIVFVADTGHIMDTGENDAILVNDEGKIGLKNVYFRDNSRVSIKKPTLMQEYIKRREKSEEYAEALRIYYVALTRAEEKLIITGLSDKSTGESLWQYEGFMDREVMSSSSIYYSKSMMDIFGKAVMRDYGHKEAGNIVKVTNIFTSDLDVFVNKMKVEEYLDEESMKLKLLAADVPDDITGYLREIADYRYPHEREISIYSKSSVTELKKMSCYYEEELDGENLYSGINADEEEKLDDESLHSDVNVDEFYTETLQNLKSGGIPKDYTVISPVKKENFDSETACAFLKEDALGEDLPGFMLDNNTEEKRALPTDRGTAYHRVFELLDMECPSYSEDSIRRMINGFVEAGYMESFEASWVNPKNILKFTKTDLFDRMKGAYARGELYRERKFLMSVPVSEIYKDVKSDDSVIIQGIIDACFLEDGNYVIVDYKTDRVHDFSELKEKYRMQLLSYKIAVEKISGCKVASTMIYSVMLGRAEEV